MRPNVFARLAACCALLLLAVPARADDGGATHTRSVEVERARSVSHNEDGSVSVDRSWEKTLPESGRTASGASTRTYTRGEEGVSWQASGERTTFDGRRFERSASGQAQRNADHDGGTFSRAATTTRRNAAGEVTGTRSSAGSGSWQRNDRGGRDWRYDGTATNARGHGAEVTREGQSWRGHGERGRSVTTQRRRR